ncbi:uncharacterized protein CC84DRAFT_1095677 [Paraphaeosphaeria sporulosa]|uniref:Uncharacterized protein n=1 Tax=Paraphaeosphaeria sporulosa TaxID=1460663 RepID=A0A177C7B2_9PLEO|nr:uncharacterized protein CC84DRAFT_1095677 [Paraphaeosphaeria sporulosa]OAG03435.1 hypothetical protein CC84DRAFT_1095677 [Paraphaeosphaeria sporulosa]
MISPLCSQAVSAGFNADHVPGTAAALISSAEPPQHSLAMVLLTMTAGAVRALARAEQVDPDEYAKLQQPDDPPLVEAKPGNPISHGQLIDLSKLLKNHAARLSSDTETGDAKYKEPIPTTLDALLRNSTVYTAPPPPKKEPTPEYKALMARLRAEEEARIYNRMLNPDPLAKTETFSQRFPNAATPFSLSTPYDKVDEDDLSYEEVHRQIILIINVLVSIVACAVFIWVAARHWSVPKRLGLSMGGSGVVAIAEVVVYSGYVRSIAEAKKREKKKPEIKKIVQSWVIDGNENKEAGSASGLNDKVDDGIRYRKGKHR